VNIIDRINNYFLTNAKLPQKTKYPKIAFWIFEKYWNNKIPKLFVKLYPKDNPSGLMSWSLAMDVAKMFNKKKEEQFLLHVMNESIRYSAAINKPAESCFALERFITLIKKQKLSELLFYSLNIPNRISHYKYNETPWFLSTHSEESLNKIKQILIEDSVLFDKLINERISENEDNEKIPALMNNKNVKHQKKPRI